MGRMLCVLSFLVGSLLISAASTASLLLLSFLNTVGCFQPQALSIDAWFCALPTSGAAAPMKSCAQARTGTCFAWTFSRLDPGRSALTAARLAAEIAVQRDRVCPLEQQTL